VLPTPGAGLAAAPGTRALFFSAYVVFFLDLPASAQVIQDPVAFIAVSAAGKTVSTGSGFLVSSQGWVITSRHVVISPDTAQPYGSVQLSFKSRNNRQVPAEIKSCGTGDIDLCLLKISEADTKEFGITPPKNSCREITDKETLTSVGWPAYSKSDVDTVEGKISGNLGPFGAYPTTLPLIGGMSGGPVYDEAGTVVGINVGALKENPTRTFILPYAYTRDLLFKSTVPACEKESSKIDLTLNIRASRTKTIQVRKLQDPGETTKHYSIEYSADPGYDIAESTLSVIYCKGCVPSDEVVLDRSRRSIPYTLYGSAGYLEGTVQVKQVRDLRQSVDLASPLKNGWHRNLQLPPDVLMVESVEVLDPAGQPVAQTPVPGAITFAQRQINLSWSPLNHSLQLSVGQN